MSLDEDLRRLGLSGAPSLDEIRVAYRRLARSNHPDLGGATSSMAEINASFDRLQAAGSLSQRPSTEPNVQASSGLRNHSAQMEYEIVEDARRTPISVLGVVFAIMVVPVTIAAIGVGAILILYGLVSWW